MLITCMKTHSMLVLLLICIAKGAISTTVDYDVGVILDMDSAVGRIGNSCLWMAHSDFYAAHADYKTRLLLHPVQSVNNVVDAAAAALNLLKDVKVDAIIGPQESALDLVMKMGNMAHVPVISFSSTTPLINQAPYFVRTAQSDANQVEAIASIVKAYSWSEVVIICEDSEFGNGIISYLINALKDVNARVPYTSMLSKSANKDSISKELNKMRSMPTRVFVVHVSQSLGINFFQQVHKLGMMTEGYVWIVTTELMDLFISGDDDVEAMTGVVGVRPLIPNSVDRLNSCGGRGKSVFCIWACDTLWALAMAVERVGNDATENEADDNSSGPFAVGVSKMGPKIYKALLETRFTGLAGEFNLINGQLGQTAYQIFNIDGSSKWQVGIWTPSKEENTSSELNLKRNIIWPGFSTKAPRGWEFPADGSKLRIAVPLKSGFEPLFKVVIDNKTKETNFSGDYKNLFDAIMKKLPYTIPHEFKAYSLRGSNRTYDDLMHHVSQQIEYDAAMGDFTVTADRSNYVDFTVPYAEGGVACIVPMKQEEIGGVWAFLKPLTTGLWIAILIFYICTSLIVWVLSKRIIQSPDFQSGIFPFLTGEGIEAILLSVIVVTWAIVASLLGATYTARLSSILTAPRLVPTVTSVAQLIKQEGHVGYPKSSFLKSSLIHLHFNESKLKSFSSYDEVRKALSKGGKNTSGYCDVMPYINYILSKGCDKYTMIYPVYQTVGFAMAFPKGFPAVDDFSRAILEMIEDGTILLYKNKTSNLSEYCGDSGTSRESLKRLSVLLAISGCVILACFVGSLLYGKRRQTSLLREVGLARLDRKVISSVDTVN